MSINNLGKFLSTNNVEIGPEKVTKRFNQFALSMLWGFLERKPLLSAKARYGREKRMIEKLAGHPDLNTPTLIDSDDDELILTFKTLGLTDLVQIFQDPSIHPDDKLQYLQMALRQLHAIHETGETHGDPYLKNFFQINEPGADRRLYTCDFEYERTGPDPAITDVMILTANAISSLPKNNVHTGKQALGLVQEIYGETPFPLSVRDRAFFHLRFGMGTEFFDHFGQKRKTYS